MKRWLKRLILGLVCLVVLAVCAGSLFEIYARRQAVRDFPPAARMVDIGGRSLQLDCRGSGSPTVVFESGWGVYGSLAWVTVHDQIAQFTRACTYSRAGILWSDPADDARDGEAVARDLNSLLRRAGEEPPFVLVGHSVGGPYAMIYTKLFGGDVAGLVLLDATSVDQDPLPNGTNLAVLQRLYTTIARLMWTGIGRMSVIENDGRARYRTVVAYEPTSLAAAGRELEALGQTLEKASAARALGQRPLYILSGVKGMTAAQIDARDARRDQDTWSVVWKRQNLPDAGHMIHEERPDVVVDAVKWVMARVRD